MLGQLDGKDNLYVVEADYDREYQGNCTARKITRDGQVTILAGLADVTGLSDGKGSEARFNLPVGIGFTKDGTIFIINTKANTIRKITPDVIVSTIGGKYLCEDIIDGIGREAKFHCPHAVAVDSNGIF